MMWNIIIISVGDANRRGREPNESLMKEDFLDRQQNTSTHTHTHTHTQQQEFETDSKENDLISTTAREHKHESSELSYFRHCG